MKVLFDTNVILDVLLDREPFVNDSAILLSMAERSEIIGYVCATTITTIHYLVEKSLGKNKAYHYVGSLISLFSIAPVNRVVLEKALKSEFKDFEDAVLYESAVLSSVQYIATRNISDFKKSTIPVFEPKELIGLLKVL